MKFVRLEAPADIARLQQLLERCSDYYELHEGCPTPSDAGEYELTFVPPNYVPDDLHVFAFEDERGVLQALLQLYRNCPQPGTWWIAFLVVAPELRSRGIGVQLLQHGLGIIGATSIRLAVSIHNPRGQKFWEAAGFRDTGKVADVTARNGHVDTVRILSLRAPSSRA
ncbi:MAG TPA: GNAT family N-acetyltransferase [Thermoanaerobaculia bacterium]|nr:GNAT family N-acetyltransferase [Thermoanaerobaculia bacterium]